MSLGCGYPHFPSVGGWISLPVETRWWRRTEASTPKLRPRLEEHKLNAGDCELFQLAFTLNSDWLKLFCSFLFFIQWLTECICVLKGRRVVPCELLEPWVWSDSVQTEAVSAVSVKSGGKVAHGLLRPHFVPLSGNWDFAPFLLLLLFLWVILLYITFESLFQHLRSRSP